MIAFVKNNFKGDFWIWAIAVLGFLFLSIPIIYSASSSLAFAKDKNYLFSQIIFIALSLGAASTSRVPLGTVVVGGILFSLILTLLVIPAVYTYFSSKNYVTEESKLAKEEEENITPLEV